MAQLDFNLLTSQAKEIDQEITYLKAKIMEPSKFGLGRNKAVEVLKGLDRELFQMKQNCTQELKITEEERATFKSDINNIVSYLKNVNDKLDKIEAEDDHGYKPFANQCSNERRDSINSSDISGITELSMADSQLCTPILHSQNYYRRDNRNPIPSITISHDFHLSTPSKIISYQ